MDTDRSRCEKMQTTILHIAVCFQRRDVMVGKSQARIVRGIHQVPAGNLRGVHICSTHERRYASLPYATPALHSAHNKHNKLFSMIAPITRRQVLCLLQDSWDAYVQAVPRMTVYRVEYSSSAGLEPAKHRADYQYDDNDE